jgi:sugar phosphate permease
LPSESRLYARVTRRLIPLLFACYVAAYLDRVNVSIAKLQMLTDLRFSGTATASSDTSSSKSRATSSCTASGRACGSRA